MHGSLSPAASGRAGERLSLPGGSPRCARDRAFLAQLVRNGFSDAWCGGHKAGRDASTGPQLSLGEKKTVKKIVKVGL